MRSNSDYPLNSFHLYKGNKLAISLEMIYSKKYFLNGKNLWPKLSDRLRQQSDPHSNN